MIFTCMQLLQVFCVAVYTLYMLCLLPRATHCRVTLNTLYMLCLLPRSTHCLPIHMVVALYREYWNIAHRIKSNHYLRNCMSTQKGWYKINTGTTSFSMCWSMGDQKTKVKSLANSAEKYFC